MHFISLKELNKGEFLY